MHSSPPSKRITPDPEPLHDWPEARGVALARDAFTCLRCGAPATDVHHRRLKGMGGSSNDETRDRPDRLVSLCRPCHDWAHAHPNAAKELGLIVPRWDATEAVPVTVGVRRWWLHPDGTRQVEWMTSRRSA